MTSANRGPLGKEGYARLWAAAIGRILTKASGAAVDTELLAPAHADEQVAAGGLWLHFHLSGSLNGEQAMALAAGDAVVLAQMRQGEAADRQAELTPERAQAITEVAQEIAADVAAALREDRGEETNFEYAGSRPLAEAAACFACRCSSEAFMPMAVAVALDATLAVALEAAPRPVEPAAAPPTPEHPVAAAPAAAEMPATTAMAAAPAADPAPIEPATPAQKGTNGNLDLLLDVPLDVSLRFGGRQLILKEILELGPGAVVELDRGVQDPVELLVAGRVVAQGEVVIVDGNYGLRVTEIAAPRHRLTSLGRS